MMSPYYTDRQIFYGAYMKSIWFGHTLTGDHEDNDFEHSFEEDSLDFLGQWRNERVEDYVVGHLVQGGF